MCFTTNNELKTLIKRRNNDASRSRRYEIYNINIIIYCTQYNIIPVYNIGTRVIHQLPSMLSDAQALLTPIILFNN